MQAAIFGLTSLVIFFNPDGLWERVHTIWPWSDFQLPQEFQEGTSYVHVTCVCSKSADTFRRNHRLWQTNQMFLCTGEIHASDIASEGKSRCFRHLRYPLFLPNHLIHSCEMYFIPRSRGRSCGFLSLSIIITDRRLKPLIVFTAVTLHTHHLARSEVWFITVVIFFFSQPLDDETSVSSPNLQLPAPHRQFLISPPASPPVGWEPVPEAEPVLNYDLIAALANLAPGKLPWSQVLL